MSSPSLPSSSPLRSTWSESPPEKVRANRRLIARLLAVVFAAVTMFRLADNLWPRAGGPDLVGALPGVRRVLIMSIDGCRPDLLMRANAPNVRWLMSRGSFTMWARTTELSNTLPSHTSMLTGVTPEYHRINWNYYVEGTYPAVPTIMDLAHKAGYTTAVVAGKTKFNELATPGSVTWVDVYHETVTRHVGEDLVNADLAAEIIHRHQPEVMFVHFGQVDETGHGIGWATPQQLAAIERADAAVGRVLSALQADGLLEQTLIILTADHGGQGKSHGPNDPRSRHIPWIVCGPNVKRNWDLTRHADLVVNTEDTFATACHLMKIPVPGKVDGKFIKQILEVPEPEPEDPNKDKPRPRDADRYEIWAAPPYKPEWERMDPGHR